MRTPLILFLVCNILPLFSQQHLVDSLNLELEKTDNPIEQIDFHLGLSRAYNFVGDNQVKREHLSLAKNLSKKYNYKKGLGISLLFEGVQDVMDGKGSIHNYQKSIDALNIGKEINSKSLIAFANYHLAEYYIYEKHDYTKGLEILENALLDIDETVPDKHIGNIYKCIATSYEVQGKDSLALRTYQKALSYFDRVRTHPFIDPDLGKPSSMEADKGLMNMGQTHVYIGKIHSEFGNKSAALAEIVKAEKIFQKTNSPSHIAWTLENAGKIYLNFDMFEEAIKQHQEAILIYESYDSFYDLKYAYHNLAALFERANDNEMAKKYFNKALDLAKQSTDTITILTIQQDLGDLNLKSQKFDLAEQHFLYAQQINSIFQDSTQMSRITANLASLYSQMEKPQKAILFLKEAITWSNYFNRKDESFDYNIKLADNFLVLNEMDSTLYYFNQAKSLQQTRTSDSLDIEFLYSKINEKQGNYLAALDNYKNYHRLSKQSFSDQAIAKLKEEQVRQDVISHQKNKELAEREAALFSWRSQLYLMAALVLIGVLLIGLYLFYQLRKVKRQLETQNIQLQQLNTTKDKFFGIIAHDIRSPIVALEGVGEQMDYYLKKNKSEKLQRLASRVDSTAKRLNGLLDNLLNWALLQQGVIPYHPKSLHVQEVAQNIAAMFQHNADAKDIQLKVDVAADTFVSADESAINTILRNLVSNAIKFTPKGGIVSIGTETKDGKVFININDTGTGIAAHQLSKLFTLDKQSELGTAGEKGTGLGLTLVKELVELNKGVLTVNSKLEQGTQFKIGLPLAA